MLFFASSVGVTVTEGFASRGVQAMWALCVVTMTMLFWGGFWTFRNKEIWYEVKGVRVVFGDRDWYVPPVVFERFMSQEVFEPFRPVAEARGINPETLLQGRQITFTKDKPRVLVRQEDGTVEREEVVGATYPREGRSLVWAPYVINPGGAGWELKLHACHMLFPDRTEAEDKAWMQKEGIIE